MSRHRHPVLGRAQINRHWHCHPPFRLHLCFQPPITGDHYTWFFSWQGLLIRRKNNWQDFQNDKKSLLSQSHTRPVWATQKHDSDITSDTLYFQLFCAFCLQIHLLPCNVCLLYFNFIFWLDVNIDMALSMFSSLVFQSFWICVFLVNIFKQTNKQTSD